LSKCRLYMPHVSLIKCKEYRWNFCLPYYGIQSFLSRPGIPTLQILFENFLTLSRRRRVPWEVSFLCTLPVSSLYFLFTYFLYSMRTLFACCYRLWLLESTNKWIDLLFFSFHLLRFTPRNLLNSELIESVNPLDIWEDTLGRGSVVCLSFCLDLYNTIQHGDTPILCAGSEP
jgi:hypothetical protein